MKSCRLKFQIILELIALSERAFLYKLKRKNSALSEAQAQESLKEWYKLRPGAEHGDGEGVPGDASRFDK